MAGDFTRDTLATITTRVVRFLLGLVSTAIIARFLGPENKGIYSLAILLPSFMVTFANFGIVRASIYYIGKGKYSPKQVLGNNIIYSAIIGAAAVLVGLKISFFFNKPLFPNVPRVYLLIALALIPLQCFLNFIISVLLGLQEIKKYNLINLIQVFGYLILVVILLPGFHLGVRAVIMSEIVSFFAACAALFFWAKKQAGGISFGMNRAYSKDFLSYGVKSYLSDIFSSLHYRADTVVINVFMGARAVGLYSVAAALSDKIWFISQSAGIVLFPKVSSENDSEKRRTFTPLVCRNVLLITLAGAIALFFLSYWIVILLFSKTFLDCVLPFQILLIGAVAISGWRILAVDLYARGKPMLNVYISFISFVLNIALNILWIPKWGIAGAAWATAASYTFAFLAIAFIYSKISDNKLLDVIFIKRPDLAYYWRFLKGLKP